MKDVLLTHNLGFPRIGEQRELKRATEAYWKGSLSEEDLIRTGAELRRAHWLKQKEAGIDLIPSNDFSFYDQMLDMSCLLANVPPRFGWEGENVDLALRFKIARGVAATHEGVAATNEGVAGTHETDCACGSKGTTASEMTKWFDTNYHYIVPEFRADTAFAISSTKPFDEFAEALALGITTKPVLIGPMTYLFLGKGHGEGFDRLTLLDQLTPVYTEILRRLAAQGAEWIQLDEPILGLDLDAEWQAAFAGCYQKLRAAVPGVKLLLAAYFGELRENAALAASLPVDALHVDFTRAERELDTILGQLPATMILSVGSWTAVIYGGTISRTRAD
jgi:5-methyltetrahydropteroyltriglutamate--homocysteine methyltransferase